MFDKREFLKSIDDPELKLFLAKGLDKAEGASRKREAFFSDFADPVKAVRLKEIAERSFGGLEVSVFGGYEASERLMVGFFPDFYTEDDKEFPIEGILIKYNYAYSGRIGHRDFLGSVLGLGIERGKIGDIILKDGQALVFAESSVCRFIIMNLEKVGHTKVSCTAAYDISEFTENRNLQEMKKTVASERVDAVLGGVFNISRGVAADAVKAGKVFVNWHPVTSVSKKLSPGDVVTLRGKGRVKIVDFLGKTKKDRLVLSFIKY